MQCANNLSSKALLQCLHKLRRKSPGAKNVKLRLPCAEVQRKLSTYSQANSKRKTVFAVTGCCVLGGISGALVYREVKRVSAQFDYISHLLSNDPTDVYIYVDAPMLKSQHGKKPPLIPVMLFPWIQCHSNDPWTLLKLAQSKDPKIRALGVKALSQQHHWHDSKYLSIAQACGRTTAVGLARSPNTDSRFFRGFHKLAPSEDTVEEELQQLISDLPREGVDRCTKYFTQDALKRGSSPSTERNELWTVDGMGILTYNRHTTIPAERIQAYCLQALFAHSQIASHCPQIVRHGGLKTLQRFYEEKLKEGKRSLVKVSQILAKILANLSVHETLHEDVIDSGWLKVLHQWLNSDDISVVLYATKALANLDRETEMYKYLDGIHLFHPQYRSQETSRVDVVFVHGLLGGPSRTWRQADSMNPAKPKKHRNSAKVNNNNNSSNNNSSNNNSSRDTNCAQSSATSSQNSTRTKPASSHHSNHSNNHDNNNNSSHHGNESHSNHNHVHGNSGTYSNHHHDNGRTTDPNYTYCWPRDWLAADCPNIRIVSVEYDTHLSEWGPKCPYDSDKRSMKARSREMVKKLQAAGVGDRPIIWVGHSMGGLMIKQMLVGCCGGNSVESEDTRLVDRTRGVLFYSTPHVGAPIAATGENAKYLLLPSVEVQELKHGSEMLKTIHSKFQDLVTSKGIRTLCLNEGCKVDLPLGMREMLVPPECGDPGFGEVHVLKDLNHLNICKPETHASHVYQLTLNFLRSLVL